MSASAITRGAVVWAPYNGDEHRFRVVDVVDNTAVLKLPGSDAGTFLAGTRYLVLSNRAPSTFDEVHGG